LASKQKRPNFPCSKTAYAHKLFNLHHFFVIDKHRLNVSSKILQAIQYRCTKHGKYFFKVYKKLKMGKIKKTFKNEMKTFIILSV